MVPVNNSTLNGLAWNRLEGSGLVLYQKGSEYASVEGFLADPPLSPPGEPKYPRVATYYCDMPQPEPEVDPARVDEGTAIASSLLGYQTLFTYVGEKPLHISLVKRELNRLAGKDGLDVQVLKGDELVWATNVPDDKDEGESWAVSAPQEVDFSLPGLESGVYMIRLLCGDDVVIENLRSDQEYLCVADQVTLADHELFGLGASRPSTLFTDAEDLEVWTKYPEAFQAVDAGGAASVSVDEEGIKSLLPLSPGIKEVHTEMGGITLRSKGSFFSFSRESLFDPQPVKTEEYSEATLSTDISFILTSYASPRKEGDWSVQEFVLDLTGMEFAGGKLKCSLLAPNLSRSQGEIVLGSIDITLEKGG